MFMDNMYIGEQICVFICYINNLKKQCDNDYISYILFVLFCDLFDGEI